MPETRIGISGWTYALWRGTFYPPALRQRDELAYASRQLNSIEINGTFYSLQRPSSFQDWYDATPDNFVFAVKGPRYITHMKRLKGIEQPLANFFASGLLLLREKLGPILWQFPPNFSFDPQRLADFFELLPRTTAAIARLAAKRDAFLPGRDHTRADADRPVRYAVEVRHESFTAPDFVKLLREHQVALCIADSAGRYPQIQAVTADFIYARLHGNEELYVSGYDDAALETWADQLERWRSQPAAGTKRGKKARRDVYVYFDNDVKVRSPLDAATLARQMGVQVPDDAAARERLEQAAPSLGPARQSWPGVPTRKKGPAKPKNRSPKARRPASKRRAARATK